MRGWITRNAHLCIDGSEINGTKYGISYRKRLSNESSETASPLPFASEKKSMCLWTEIKEWSSTKNKSK